MTIPPLPWFIEKGSIDKKFPAYNITSSDGKEVFQNFSDPDLVPNYSTAAFIVRAVNSHEELVEALISAQPFIQWDKISDEVAAKIEQALAKAKGDA